VLAFSSLRAELWRSPPVPRGCGKSFRNVILSEAKNLALSLFNARQDPSSLVAPQDDRAHVFFRNLPSPETRLGVSRAEEDFANPKGAQDFATAVLDLDATF